MNAELSNSMNTAKDKLNIKKKYLEAELEAVKGNAEKRKRSFISTSRKPIRIFKKYNRQRGKLGRSGNDRDIRN